MPLVIASMLTATNEPRTLAGTSSAIYIGEMNEAMPMAMPLTIIPAINQVTVGASAVPRALAVKMMPARMINLRRPKRSVKAPPRTAPKTAPNRTALTTISSIVEDRENCFLMNKYGPGNDARVVAEEQAPDGRDPHGDVNERFDGRFGLILHPVPLFSAATMSSPAERRYEP